ncbi:Foldase protein prsA precursor [Chlamydia abortus]|uniref:peptidylprolyl isomerase n=1 Tax=Paenibacillus residui TaxID=629724 RepID=A0ABW3DBL7_9BACL|nr:MULTISPECIES: peptidylprolyl isomerase [Paenibacillaceae]SHE14458.1 Foldase protein prsA precursor [Chlamydia abortus]
MRNTKWLVGLNVLLAAAVILLSALLLLRNSSVSPSDNGALPPKDDKIVGRVGDQDILLSVLEDKLLQKYGAELLNQMLDRTAIQLEADEMGLAVSEEEITHELSRMSQGYESMDAYYRSMKEQLGLTREELRDDVYYKLLLEKLATSNVKVTDKEIEDYIQAHKDEFRDTVHLRISQVISASLEQANKVYELASGGSDFARLAAERSLDTMSASDGGDLGWIEDNDPFVDESILQAARSMEIGEISRPIPLDGGYAVIKLTNRKVDSIGTKEQIHEMVKKRLSLQKAPPLKEVVATIRKKREAVILDTSLQS